MSGSRTGFRIYGITGGIASGKSTAAGYFRDLGIPVVDADEIARDLRAPGGAAAPAILARFGTLDRQELRAVIAKDPHAKKDLEGILHPLIAKESLSRFAALAQAAEKLPEGAPNHPAYALYEAALLIEAGRAGDFEAVILVESENETQIDRLVKRDGMSPENARQFLGMQVKDHRASLEEKRRVSKYFISNDGTLEGLREKVRALHSALLRGEKSFRV